MGLAEVEEELPSPLPCDAPLDIGEFGDAGPSSLYAARLLARRFLLVGETGELIPDRQVTLYHLPSPPLFHHF